MMSIQDYQTDLNRRHALGPDIVEECQVVSNIIAGNPEDWVPLFEPTSFNECHGPLELEKYSLSA